MASSIEANQQATEIASQIRTSLNDPFQVEGTQLALAASIGTSFYPEDGDNLSLLLRVADAAMYQEKLTGSFDS